ncbi:MAG: hypothetical protein ACTSRG_24725, partial [Candidatus Helarchaeota archaeon]
NGIFIFDYVALKKGKLFENAPSNFSEILTDLKKGDILPLNLGDMKWVLFSELFENKIIKLNRYSSTMNFSKEIDIYGDNYAFPINKEYIKIFNHKSFNSISAESSTVKDKYIIHEYVQHIVETNQFFREKITQEIVEDNRSIAIWPPFSSKLLPTYMIEYDLDGINDRPQSIFYTHSGEIINSNIVRENDRIRVYKIDKFDKDDSRYEFPYFIQIFTANNESGIIHVNPKEITPSIKEIKVGLDFGSSNTTVAYIDKKQLDDYFKQGDFKNFPIKLMNFKESSPIILADDDSKGGLLHNFIPLEIKENPPSTVNDYTIVSSWIPFRTLWRFIQDVPEQVDCFLNGGVIPLSDHPENLFSCQELKSNLKWDTDSKYRNGFLSHILNMILIESEKLGAEKIEIRWSKPKAFSDSENLTMESFYQIDYKTNRKDIVDIKESGFSEALCSKEYFLKKEEFVSKNIVSTVDIGGGTTDITFFVKDEQTEEDSVKFGGDDIGNQILSKISYFLKSDIVSGSEKDYSFDARMRLWPAVHKTWNGGLANFKNTKPLKYYEIIGLFYSGIVYYIGLKMKDLNIHNPLKYIAFAGNGIKFFNICTIGKELNEKNLSPWIQLFKYVIAEGHGLKESDYKDLKFVFSKNPKKEVAYGLTLVEDDRSDSGTIRPMLGLDIQNDQHHHKWNYKEKIKCRDIAKNYSINYKNFEQFISTFYRSISRIKSDYFDDIKKPDIKMEDLEDNVTQLLLNRKDYLVTPLFLLALKSWINKL